MLASSRSGAWLRKLCAELLEYREGGDIPPAPRGRRRPRRWGPRRIEATSPPEPELPPRDNRFSARGRSLEQLRRIVGDLRREFDQATEIHQVAAAGAPVLLELWHEPAARTAWALEVLQVARFKNGAASRSDARFVALSVPTWRAEDHELGELPNIYLELGLAAEQGIDVLAELVSELAGAIGFGEPAEGRIQRLLEVALTLERDGVLEEDPSAAESV